MNHLSTDAAPERNFGLTADDRREIACPAKGGETIAGGRCLSQQEVGCYCPKARGAIDAMQDVADARSIWVRKEPEWKIKLGERLIEIRRRADLLDSRSITHAVPP